MDERIVDFVNYVRAHPGIASSVVAEHFDVGVRTVRNWLHEANEVLEDTAEITSDRGNYTLTMHSRRRFERLVAVGNSIWSRTPSTSDRRVAYLLSNLLFRESWVTIDALAEGLFVTRRTVSTSLKDVERELAAYGLYLERRPHHGIRVQGDELDRRRCLAHMIALNANMAGNLTKGGYAVMGNTTVGVLSDCARAVLLERGVVLSGGAFRNLMVHLCIALGRADGGYEGTLSDDMRSGMRATDEYPLAHELALRAAELSGIALNDSEDAYLTLCLMALQGVSRKSVFVESDYAATVTDIAAEAFTRIDAGYRMSLSHDAGARAELVARLVPMLTRLQYGIDRGAYLSLEAAMTIYPLAAEMARVTADVVQHKRGMTVPDEELVMLTLYFALVLEAPDTCVDGVRVLVVGEYGRDGARLLCQRLSGVLGSHASQITLQAFDQLVPDDWAQADVVVATDSLPEEIALPAMRISAFPREEELARVRLFLARIPRKS